jgi:hypothetical protein
MAHSCPTCYVTCYCGGDIDDLVFDNSKEQFSCTHCEEYYGDEDYWPDDDSGECPVLLETNS